MQSHFLVIVASLYINTGIEAVYSSLYHIDDEFAPWASQKSKRRGSKFKGPMVACCLLQESAKS